MEADAARRPLSHRDDRHSDTEDDDDDHTEDDCLAASDVLGLGIMRLALTIILPLAILRAHLVHSTQTIELPKNFCELDRRAECKVGQCLRYDPKKFRDSPSVVTYLPGGRLGNMLTAFLTLLWLKLELGVDVYQEKEPFQTLHHYFEHVDQIPVLEDSLCDWRQFPFTKYEGDVELLGAPEWSVGKAVQIWIDKANFMRHEIQGGRKFYKKYRAESLRALTFRPKFRRHAEITLQEIARKMREKDLKSAEGEDNQGECSGDSCESVKAKSKSGKSKKKGKKKQKKKSEVEITYVAVHDRRTDYLEFRKRRLGLENLYEEYFEDAMAYFREEYERPVFVFTSDDMAWGRRQLRQSEDIFFVGCGNPDDVDCVGKDFALLSSCNHTITTHGTFGHWAAFISGGEIYTEYGAIVPDAYA